MRWTFNDFKKWVGSGCDNKIGLNVMELNISNEYLMSIPNEVFKLTTFKRI